MFSRTLDNQTSPLLSDILKVGYKTLLIGERAFEMSHSSLNYSEQSEGRLIDFDEESSVSENELNQTGHSNELIEQQQGDNETIDVFVNLSTLNNEEVFFNLRFQNISHASSILSPLAYFYSQFSVCYPFTPGP
ncbi:unnamed protein product [Meloidogyne enterolobii]|uniref:Uncharacterized protein n=1 Tax=Meloidogyne enterolobii TaxID=390850 RepID=A0ACB0XW67_MELEN